MVVETQSTLYSNEYKYKLPRQSTMYDKKTIIDFEKISMEYGLKRNNFNPKNNSPNMFINKLKKRFNSYYS